jgi:hypothetical protein
MLAGFKFRASPSGKYFLLVDCARVDSHTGGTQPDIRGIAYTRRLLTLAVGLG